MPQFIPYVHKSVSVFHMMPTRDTVPSYQITTALPHVFYLYLFYLFTRNLKLISSEKFIHQGFIVFSSCLCGVDPQTSVSLDYELFRLVPWFLRLGVHLFLEIKCYKSRIRILKHVNPF